MENIQSCCFVAKIDEIKPILGADKIELAVLKGWQSIVQKDIHKVGDLVVCLTTDAVIPQDFCDLHGITSYLRKGNRIKTVKLKGVYSECILIALNSNNIPFKLTERLENFYEGRDLGERLDVYKYEEPVKQIQLSSGKKIKYKANPNFHVYYKFPNYKNVPDIFNENDRVVITRKIHGTNARYGIVRKSKITLWDKIKQFFKRDPWWEYEFVYGSHMVEKGSDSQGFYSTDVWKDILEKYNLKDKLQKMVKFGDEYIHIPTEINGGFILYGEIYGPGIQKGYDYNEKEHQFKAFDIEYNGEYLDTDNFNYFTSVFQIPKVEVLYEGMWSKEVQEKYSKPVLIPNSKMYEEGIVIKSIDGNKKKRAKIVSQEYLIQQDKTDGTDFH